MTSLGTLLDQAHADRTAIEALRKFAETHMSELASQMYVGFAGPFKYLEASDERSERLRVLVNEHASELLEAIQEIASEIPDDDDITELHDDRERESHRTFKYAAE